MDTNMDIDGGQLQQPILCKLTGIFIHIWQVGPLLFFLFI